MLTRLMVCLAVSFCVASGAPAAAQDQTLADIRQELSVLFVEVQRMKRELSTTGSPGGVAGGGTVLDRVDRIEAELRRLTSKTEELEFRIGQVVRDGTNRIGDLEFRLCELEADCDIGSLGETTTLGGGAAPAVAAPQPQTQATQTELAVGEQADFDRAKAALDQGDFRRADELFSAFTQTYTGGPLTVDATYFRAEALTGLGQTKSAGRAYLESFTLAPQGPRAPDALLRLGLSLGDLGQTSEACLTLNEVGVRFPGAPQVAQAQAARQSLGCS